MSQPTTPGDHLEAPRPKRGLRKRILGFLILLLVSTLVLNSLIVLMFHVCPPFQEQRSFSSLRNCALAIERYDTFKGEFPANTYAPDGTPLLSWRVHILPYLEPNEVELYSQFNVNEPWNSPHNIQLLSQMPNAYKDPKKAATLSSDGMTVFRGFSNPGTVFEKRPIRAPAVALLGGPLADLKTRHSLENFADPLSETILVVEAAEAVEWTRPDDLDATLGKPFPPLAQRGDPPRASAAFADGSVQKFKATLPETMRRALTTHSGGEKLPPDWNE